VVDETGTVCWSGKFGNDQKAIESVIARAGKTGVELRWVIDPTSALAALLITVLLVVFDYSNRSPLILVAGLSTPAGISTAGIGGAATYFIDDRA
jgi:hypothetical protein